MYLQTSAGSVGGSISNNTASIRGAGVYVSTGTVTISAKVEANKISIDNKEGAGIYINSATVTISGAVTNNTLNRGRGAGVRRGAAYGAAEPFARSDPAEHHHDGVAAPERAGSPVFHASADDRERLQPQCAAAGERVGCFGAEAVRRRYDRHLVAEPERGIAHHDSRISRAARPELAQECIAHLPDGLESGGETNPANARTGPDSGGDRPYCAGDETARGSAAFLIQRGTGIYRISGLQCA